jgi:hypothetical protein
MPGTGGSKTCLPAARRPWWGDAPAEPFAGGGVAFEGVESCARSIGAVKRAKTGKSQAIRFI